MRDMDDWAEDWMDQARLTLASAEEMLAGGLPTKAISNAFLSMVYAARAALGGVERDISDLEDVVQLFLTEALPALGLSKGNQRALTIVGELYRHVEIVRDMEADPLTAAACLSDARGFVTELESKIGPSDSGLE
ncbi:MAG: HEPN domain-containing protein [Actinomycetota bacterium]|nr:HEPN domain-containing protein [Actinomycetota bacterium]